MVTKSPWRLNVHDNAQPRERAFPNVTIYTSNDCRWCGAAKEYLGDHGVPYTEKNVEEDEATATEALGLTGGRRGTPIIVVGSEVVLGFQRHTLSTLLGLDPPDTEDAG
jgi:alkyl hydroperoxide reductase subunit F